MTTTAEPVAPPCHIAAAYWLPEFHVRTEHQHLVRASVARTWQALLAANFSDSFLVRTLMRLRGYGGQTLRRGGAASLQKNLRGGGFIELAHEPEHQFVAGLVGQFWLPRGGLCRQLSPQQFDAFADPGYCKATWSFVASAISPRETLIATETRVYALSPAALRKFRAYWLFVGPFSGLLRREMLKLVAAAAER